MSQEQLNDLQPSDAPSQDNGYSKAQTLPDPNQNIEQQIDLITELTLKLKEKQGTERKEVHALIDKTIRELVSEARIDELKNALFQDELNHNGMEDYLERRLKELKQTPPTPNGDRTAEAYRDMRREMGDDLGASEKPQLQEEVGGKQDVTLSEFIQFKNRVVDIYRPLFDPKIDAQQMAYLLSQCTIELREAVIGLVENEPLASKDAAKKPNFIPTTPASMNITTLTPAPTSVNREEADE